MSQSQNVVSVPAVASANTKFDLDEIVAKKLTHNQFYDLLLSCCIPESLTFPPIFDNIAHDLCSKYMDAYKAKQDTEPYLDYITMFESFVKVNSNMDVDIMDKYLKGYSFSEPILIYPGEKSDSDDELEVHNEESN